MISFKVVRRGDKFAQMERRAPQEAARISSGAANMTISIGSQLAPRRTGHLAGSGFVEQVNATRFIVGFAAIYAHFVNFGTVYMDADPFFSIAFELARKWFMEEQAKFFERVAS